VAVQVAVGRRQDCVEDLGVLALGDDEPQRPPGERCHLDGVDSTGQFGGERALDILVPLGEYFQIQDDYLDYSGTPEQIGKIGTDIMDNKCSWCINTALHQENGKLPIGDNYHKLNLIRVNRTKLGRFINYLDCH